MGKIYDSMVQMEDAFFQDVADSWKQSTARERVVGIATAVTIGAAAIGGFNSLVNNIDVSEGEAINFSMLAYSEPTSGTNVQWDGLNP